MTILTNTNDKINVDIIKFTEALINTDEVVIADIEDALIETKTLNHLIQMEESHRELAIQALSETLSNNGYSSKEELQELLNKVTSPIVSGELNPEIIAQYLKQSTEESTSAIDSFTTYLENNISLRNFFKQEKVDIGTSLAELGSAIDDAGMDIDLESIGQSILNSSKKHETSEEKNNTNSDTELENNTSFMDEDFSVLDQTEDSNKLTLDDDQQNLLNDPDSGNEAFKPISENSIFLSDEKNNFKIDIKKLFENEIKQDSIGNISSALKETKKAFEGKSVFTELILMSEAQRNNATETLIKTVLNEFRVDDKESKFAEMLNLNSNPIGLDGSVNSDIVAKSAVLNFDIIGYEDILNSGIGKWMVLNPSLVDELKKIENSSDKANEIESAFERHYDNHAKFLRVNLHYLKTVVKEISNIEFRKSLENNDDINRDIELDTLGLANEQLKASTNISSKTNSELKDILETIDQSDLTEGEAVQTELATQTQNETAKLKKDLDELSEKLKTIQSSQPANQQPIDPKTELSTPLIMTAKAGLDVVSALADVSKDAIVGSLYLSRDIAVGTAKYSLKGGKIVADTTIKAGIKAYPFAKTKLADQLENLRSVSEVVSDEYLKVATNVRNSIDEIKAIKKESENKGYPLTKATTLQGTSDEIVSKDKTKDDLKLKVPKQNFLDTSIKIYAALGNGFEVLKKGNDQLSQKVSKLNDSFKEIYEDLSIKASEKFEKLKNITSQISHVLSLKAIQISEFSKLVVSNLADLNIKNLVKNVVNETNIGSWIKPPVTPSSHTQAQMAIVADNLEERKNDLFLSVLSKKENMSEKTFDLLNNEAHEILRGANKILKRPEDFGSLVIAKATDVSTDKSLIAIAEAVNSRNVLDEKNNITLSLREEINKGYDYLIHSPAYKYKDSEEQLSHFVKSATTLSTHISKEDGVKREVPFNNILKSAIVSDNDKTTLETAVLKGIEQTKQKVSLFDDNNLSPLKESEKSVSNQNKLLGALSKINGNDADESPFKDFNMEQLTASLEKLKDTVNRFMDKFKHTPEKPSVISQKLKA